MFIWDFVADTVLGQIIYWIYGQMIGFLGDFFAQMGNMGVELFDMSWVQSIVLFFSYLAWALYGTDIGTVAARIIETMKAGGGVENFGSANAFGGLSAITSTIMALVGYAVIKVFFANLKRGGILLIQIAVGSLYMFSVPRGYMDGFYSGASRLSACASLHFYRQAFLRQG